MKKIFIILLLSFIAICCCLLFLDPYTLTPLQFVPVIGLVYLFSALAIYAFIFYFTELKDRARVLTSMVLAFTPTILCALMTLGNLAAIDVVLAVTVPALITWYGIRIKR